MKVLLINPYDSDQGGYSSPPLGLAYLAGTLIKNNIDTRIVDGYLVGKLQVEKEIINFCPDIIGITCYTPGRKQALEIAEFAKYNNFSVTIVMGGAHVSIMWKQIMHHYSFVDICVLGEGEQTLLEITQNKIWNDINGIVWRDKGIVVKNRPRKYVENLDCIPFPAWHLLSLNNYPARGDRVYNGVDLTKEIRIPVIFSRGCVGHCNFCSTWWIWKGQRNRTASNMVAELEMLKNKYGFVHYCFYDDAFSANMDEAKELCRTIINRKLKIVWCATTRADRVDEELLILMKKAGCYEIAYGVESASKRVLELMNKETSIEKVKESVLKTNQIGINSLIMLIIGNVGENKESINETVSFLNEVKTSYFGYAGNLWALPGTVLYQQLKKEGLINDDFWLSDEPFYIYPKHSKKEMSRFVFAISKKRKIGSISYFLTYYSFRRIVYNKLRNLLLKNHTNE